MEYKIGEVSKILNISKEMIRYYEKQGILKMVVLMRFELMILRSGDVRFIQLSYSTSKYILSY